MIFDKLLGAVAALCLVTAAQAQVLPGHAYVKNVSGTYEGFTPSGATQCSSSTTNCINEMLSYAWTNNVPLDIFGEGQTYPFNNTAAFTVPAGTGQYVKCYGCYFNVNYGTGDVMTVDTNRYSEIDFSGSYWVIGQSKYGIHIQPNNSISWNEKYTTQSNHMSFGSITANTTSGDAPTNLFTLDLNSQCGSSQITSSSINDNTFDYTVLDGSTVATHNLNYLSPTCANSTGGENTFRWANNLNAATAEVVIGNSSGATNDGLLGTNHYFGNLQHTASSGYAVISDSIDDYFLAPSVNEYGGTPYVWYWATKACGNVTRSLQFIYGTAFNGGPTHSCTVANVFGAP